MQVSQCEDAHPPNPYHRRSTLAASPPEAHPATRRRTSGVAPRPAPAGRGGRRRRRELVGLLVVSPALARLPVVVVGSGAVIAAVAVPLLGRLGLLARLDEQPLPALVAHAVVPRDDVLVLVAAGAQAPLEQALARVAAQEAPAVAAVPALVELLAHGGQLRGSRLAEVSGGGGGGGGGRGFSERPGPGCSAFSCVAPASE